MGINVKKRNLLGHTHSCRFLRFVVFQKIRDQFMNIRVFDTINPSARVMLFAMVGNMLSARAMLVRICALFARGHGRTMPDFHEKFLWPK